MNCPRLNKSWQNLRSEPWNVTLTSILKTPKLILSFSRAQPDELMNDDVIIIPGGGGEVETFQKLQKAKEILTNEESRARYDHWRRSQMSMPFQQWEALSDSVKTQYNLDEKALVGAVLVPVPARQSQCTFAASHTVHVLGIFFGIIPQMNPASGVTHFYHPRIMKL
ncbi:dnaJ homolog subfamily C member 12 isoform X4 [Manis javanica]|uniref:dnaJ homolog subfamily C member 12 isoform X4 n=1 Tax=Manis javanica TaxID=9974 RepID=UPI003C6D56A1